jgi:hypothetical protein
VEGGLAALELAGGAPLIPTLLDMLGVNDMLANMELSAPIRFGKFKLPGLFNAGEEMAAGERAAGLLAEAEEGSGVLEGLEQCAVGANSFSADTQVATDKGEKPISDMQVGDTVLAYDQQSGTTESHKVQAVLKHDDPVIVHLTIDDEHIQTTPEHPFYTLERGWVNAGELKVGEHIRKADGGYGKVERVEREQRQQTMYNLTVEKAHTFFVGTKRWLVHNTCNPLPPESGVPQHVTEAIAGTLKENEALGITDMDVGTHFSLLEKGFDIPFKPVGADTLAKLEGSGLRLVKTQGGLTAVVLNDLDAAFMVRNGILVPDRLLTRTIRTKDSGIDGENSSG